MCQESLIKYQRVEGRVELQELVENQRVILCLDQLVEAGEVALRTSEEETVPRVMVPYKITSDLRDQQEYRQAAVWDVSQLT